LLPGRKNNCGSERDILRNVDRLAAPSEAESLAYSAEASASAAPGAACRSPKRLRRPVCCRWPRRSTGPRRRSRTRVASCRTHLLAPEADPARLEAIDDRLALIMRQEEVRPDGGGDPRRSRSRAGEITRWEQGSTRLAGLDREIAAVFRGRRARR
jgi:hypothetical protein